MTYDFHRKWLAKKFEEIKTRTLKAIRQLDDERLNRSLDDVSHTIPTLLRHIEGNIDERIRRGMFGEDITRDREREFRREFMPLADAESLVLRNMDYVIGQIRSLPDAVFEETQLVRGKERSNLDMLHQCAAHFSEHMGQILYVSKHLLQKEYRSTSI
ncbi:DUF1572 family protein [Cohnella fermenti]|uniref:DUF1572 domain-containing protein n=1 Tax=Cohnella fermenti TaxID=2565925 RepID=A0A4S4BII2_9BACL|nr:DUF1572 family protein [Cohnella fermenti]THF73402.1 DUF1572 domain-containing protein [Cohnella fermenti]